MEKETVTESQLNYLIMDRKHLLNECRILNNKIKTYERIIGICIALIIILSIGVVLNG